MSARDDFEPQPFSGDGYVCADGVCRVWIFEPQAHAGAGEIYWVVVSVVRADRGWDRVGDVSVFAVDNGIGDFRG